MNCVIAANVLVALVVYFFRKLLNGVFRLALLEVKLQQPLEWAPLKWYLTLFLLSI